MANTLRFKRGLVSTIPTALAGEPLFTTDTFDLYIGNGTTNTRFQKYIASGTTSQLLRGDGSLLTMPIVLTSPANGQVLKYDGTNWVNSADAGVTGSGTAGQVTYWGSTSTITGSNNLFWDATNNRLGIGRTSPLSILHLGSTGGAPIYIEDTDATSTFNITSISNNGGNFNLETRSSAGAFVSTDYQLVKDTASSTYHRWFTAANTERMRLFNTGNLVLGSTTDNGQRFQVTGTSYLTDTLRVDGNVSIGSAPSTARLLNITKNISGAITSYGSIILSNVQSDVTSGARVYYSEIGTAAASFTLTEIVHYYAVQGTFGAGSAVTNQYGYRVFSNLTGATNNYGFFGDIASGTGRWNLYMNGTAENYLAGNLGIGTTTPVAIGASWGGIDIRGASGGGLRFGVTSGANFTVYANASAAVLTTSSALPIIFGNSNTERMRLDASGNLGLGVVPSAWVGVANALQVGSAGVTSSFFNSGIDGMHLASNAFFDTSTYKYIANGTATIFRSAQGQFRWLQAPSGTANANITFTQAMTLDASGNLLVGGTSVYGATITSYGTSTRSGGIGIRNSAGTIAGFFGTYAAGSGSGSTDIVAEAAGFMAISTGGSERHRFFSDGNVGIGTTTNAGFKLDVNGTMRVSGASTFTTLTATSNNASVINARSGNAGGYAYYSVGRTSEEAVFGVAGAINQFFIGAVAGDVFIGANNNKLHFGTNASTALPYLTLNNGAATFSGNVGIGTSPAAVSLNVNRNISGAATSFGIVQEGTIQSTVSNYYGYSNQLRTAAATYTITNAYHYFAAQSALGAGSTITNQYGFVADVTMANGTNNYAFVGGINNASGSWNIFMNGSAPNYMNGDLLLGSFTNTNEKLQVNGTAKITSKLSMGAGTTSNAQINLASSTAPTSPNNGDIWFDGTDLKMRIGGVTKTFTLI